MFSVMPVPIMIPNMNSFSYIGSNKILNRNKIIKKVTFEDKTKQFLGFQHAVVCLLRGFCSFFVCLFNIC